MKNYHVRVDNKAWIVKATSARVAINKVLRSVIGTRTIEAALPITIVVSRTNPSDVKETK